MDYVSGCNGRVSLFPVFFYILEDTVTSQFVKLFLLCVTVCRCVSPQRLVVLT